MFSKQNVFKGCYQGQNVTILAILERLEFKHLSVFHGPSTLKSILYFAVPVVVAVCAERRMYSTVCYHVWLIR